MNSNKIRNRSRVVASTLDLLFNIKQYIPYLHICDYFSRNVETYLHRFIICFLRRKKIMNNATLDLLYIYITCKGLFIYVK